MWTALCTLLLAITVMLAFIRQHEAQMDEQTDQGRLELYHSKWEFSEVLLVTVGAVCQQGQCFLCSW